MHPTSQVDLFPVHPSSIGHSILECLRCLHIYLWSQDVVDVRVKKSGKSHPTLSIALLKLFSQAFCPYDILFTREEYTKPLKDTREEIARKLKPPFLVTGQLGIGGSVDSMKPHQPI